LPGETAGLGAAGWAAGAAELARDFAAIGRQPDVLVVACGSGLTCAGLALGMKHLRLSTRVIGISVQQPADRLLPWIIESGNRAAALMGWETRLDEADLTITDDQIAPGYGRASAASLAAVRLAGREAGLVLDPVYTGKALAGLIALVQAERIAGGAHAVFVHSGGAPGLLHHAVDFEP
jgi:1-aminocyclopropane-1-carboxylate deaminase/D-cysteine desulfhydrase-like pyridoxal-dependent ACC family enzyme